MTKEEYESLQDEVIRQIHEQMYKLECYSLKFSYIKHKVEERLLAEKGGISLPELWEEINKEFEKE